MKIYKTFVPQLKVELCLQETWQTGISTPEHENCIIFSSGLDPNHVQSRRGEQGARILLSENAVTV